MSPQSGQAQRGHRADKAKDGSESKSTDKTPTDIYGQRSGTENSLEGASVVAISDWRANDEWLLLKTPLGEFYLEYQGEELELDNRNEDCTLPGMSTNR